MDLPELTTRYDIGKVLDHMGLINMGAEIGVAFGEHAEIILDTCSIKRLALIDPWAYVPCEDPTGYADAIKDWDGCFEYCKNKMARFGSRVAIGRTTSVEAAASCADRSLDFVYIDANHMRPMIDNDLRAWWPKVRPGGIIGGHDYHMIDTPEYKCEVKAAVDEFFSGQTIHTTTTDLDPSWYIIK